MKRYEKIPQELKTLPQWVCSYSGRKIPISPMTGQAASSTDPVTWADFATAYAAVADGRCDYCGFVFHDNGIVGIDIDAGYTQTGEVTQTASEIIRKCHSYTERSKSGRGFHIFLKGRLPFKGRNNLKGIEIYQSSRFFIMTGEVVIFDRMIENQPAIDWIVSTHFGDARESAGRLFAGKIYRPVWEKPENGRVKIRPVYPEIPAGSRNICLASLAGTMHNQGYAKQDIYNELKRCNKTSCTPPLDDRELQTICDSITKYKR